MTSPLPTDLPEGERAVATRGIGKRFGSTVALSDLALTVPTGAVYLLVGPNGAGKSTTLRILLGLLEADAGTADVFGMDVRTNGPRVRANIGYVPEHTEWGYGWMNVGELVAHHARYFPAWDYEYQARLAKLLEIDPSRRMRKLSKGQARRVHLLMALAHRPPLLLLDEPTDGLDPVMRDEVLGLLAQHLAESPTTVVLSTHHVMEVERLADHIGVLRSGRLRAQMSVEAMGRNLRRYRADVPDGWRGVETLNGAVLRRSAAAREVQWTVWGDETEVTRQLASAGAIVRDAAPLSLHDAALALLDNREDRT